MIYLLSCDEPAPSHIFQSRLASAFRSPATSPFSAASPTPPSSVQPSFPKSKKRHPSMLPLPPWPKKFVRSRMPPATASPAARSLHEPERLAPPYRRNRQEARRTLERALAVRSRNRQTEASGENSALST